MPETLELGSVLQMAIARERAAQSLYRELATRVSDEASRDALLFLVEEERHHEELLENYRSGRMPEGRLGLKTAVDGALVEHLGEPPWDPGWEPAQAFLAAAEQERAAHVFYLRLAEEHPPGATRELLERLAREELAHKEKVEYLYANTAFPQTDGG